MPMLQVHGYSDDFLDHFWPFRHELCDRLKGSFALENVRSLPQTRAFLFHADLALRHGAWLDSKT